MRSGSSEAASLRRRTHPRLPQDRVGFWPTSSGAWRPLTSIRRCQTRSGCDGMRCPSATWPQSCPPGSRTPSGACRQSWPDATCYPYSVMPTGKRRTCAGGTERHTSSTTGTASPGCPKRRSPEARLRSSRARAGQHSRRSKAPKPSFTPTKANAAPASRPTRLRSPGRRASGKLCHNARDELVYNRPKLNYEQLKAQRVERLARADA